MTYTQSETLNDKNDPLKNKQQIDLISKWYESYYLWSNTYMVNTILSSNLAQNSARFSYSNIHITNNQQSTSQTQPNQTNQANQSQTRNVSPQIPQIRFYKVPSLFKRFMAEFFDAIYIQCCKIFVAIILLNYTDLIDEDSFKFFDFIEDILNEDNLNNIRLPVELLFLEVLYVSISVAFEAFCLYRKGYTPGKYLFNLKVISCSHVSENLINNTIQVYPGTQLSLKSIVIRTCLKNFSIVFLFPTIVFFLLPAFTEHGQTSYDKAVDSLVVEGI